MHTYDFSSLNPPEFEALVNDLLSSEFNTTIEAFKPGKDQGIDGRFYQDQNSSCIIQSKHYAGTGFKQLLYKLKNYELPKINKLCPSRYIIATSVPLSPNDKDTIIKILHPHIKRTDDVLGCQDINNLIAKHSNVERNHFKLWICSSPILHRFIYSATYNASRQEFETALESTRSYVVTTSHLSARAILESANVIVITGDPGVGKTTLAEQLFLESIANGYELIVIKNNIEEAQSVFDLSTKQIFYFDDFLGRNFLDTLRFNEDSRIMKFISSIHKSKNKRFILTSRTNIIDQGYILGQSFSISKLSKNEFVLDIGKYNPTERANILYNFMWKSSLSKEYLQEIVAGKKYFKIINHKNYNPRILEFITSSELVNFTSPPEYHKYIESCLDNPKEVWDNPYSVQLDDLSRAVIDFVVLSNGNIYEHSLQNAYYNYTQNAKYHTKTNTSRDFDSIVRTLSRSFIKRSLPSSHDTKAKYSPFNPSISDYIIDRYLKNHNKFAEMITYYEDDTGLAILEDLIYTKPNDVNSIAAIVVKFLNEKLSSKSFSFISRLGNLLTQELFEQTFQNAHLEYIFSQINGYANDIDHRHIDFITKSLDLCDPDGDSLVCLMLTMISKVATYYDLDCFSYLISSYEYSDHNHKLLSDAFRDKLIQIWSEDVVQDFASENIDKFTSLVTYTYNDEVDSDIEIDKDKLSVLASESTCHLFATISPEEAYDVISDLNLDDMARDYYSDIDWEDSRGHGSVVSTTGIDALFSGFIESKYND